MRNLRLTLEYDGTGYAGFQRQRTRPTVQGDLEAALQRVLGEPVPVTAASRTDAGAHALGQVVNFRTGRPIPLDRLVSAVNGRLPAQIRVRDAAEADDGFHSRFSARSRTYAYLVLNRPQGSALLERFCYHTAAPVDWARVNEAMRRFVGAHDFGAFTTGGAGRNVPREVYRAGCRRRGAFAVLTVEGNAFLYQMVRRMVTLALQIGGSGGPTELVTDVLVGKEARLRGAPVPARGLLLQRVRY